jgi:hypothetical protein
LGEKPIPAPQPTTPEEDAEAARIFEEEMFWEDYCDRNRVEVAGKPQSVQAKSGKPTTAPPATPA